MRLIHYDTARRVAIRAKQRGARQVSLTTVQWDIAGSCTAPVEITLCGRPEGRKNRKLAYGFDPVFAAKRLKWCIENRSDAWIGSGEKLPIFVDISTKCRKCEACMNSKRLMWKHRAQRETSAAERTWFATLTVAPQHQYAFKLKTITRLKANGVDFDSLDSNEQHKQLCKSIGEDITKFFKRLRRNTGGAIKYLLVSEQHKSGLPHFHALIHDIHPTIRVTKRDLEREWTLGFTKFKLVDYSPKAIHYVTKYVSKDLACRIRSSLRYGSITALAIVKDPRRETSSSSLRDTSDLPPAFTGCLPPVYRRGTVLGEESHGPSTDTLPKANRPSSGDFFDPRTWWEGSEASLQSSSEDGIYQDPGGRGAPP
jgi:hypothetical protein